MSRRAATTTTDSSPHDVMGNPANFFNELDALNVPQFMREQAFMREFADDQAQDDVYDYFL